jgi:hypothetical protein
MRSLIVDAKRSYVFLWSTQTYIVAVVGPTTRNFESQASPSVMFCV